MANAFTVDGSSPVLNNFGLGLAVKVQSKWKLQKVSDLFCSWNVKP